MTTKERIAFILAMTTFTVCIVIGVLWISGALSGPPRETSSGSEPDNIMSIGYEVDPRTNLCFATLRRSPVNNPRWLLISASLVPMSVCQEQQSLHDYIEKNRTK